MPLPEALGEQLSEWEVGLSMTAAATGKYRGSVKYLLVYSELIQAARYRGTVTYQEIALIMNLPLTGNHMGVEVGHVLGEISADEVQNGRPMLSSVVTGVSGQPGTGFFALAEELGLLKDGSDDGKQRFWKETRQSVYSVWQKQLKSG